MRTPTQALPRTKLPSKQGASAHLACRQQTNPRKRRDVAEDPKRRSLEFHSIQRCWLRP